MSVISFQTNRLKSRRKAIIDGHEYTVRQYGNIERFEVLRLQDEISDIIGKYPKDTPEEDFKKSDLDMINKKAMRASEILISLFDDGTEDQMKSRKLVSSLTDVDIIEMLEEIFKQTKSKESTNDSSNKS